MNLANVFLIILFKGSLIISCDYRQANGICLLEGVGLDQLLDGGKVEWIQKIICYECAIGYFNDETVYKLWTVYPHLKSFVMSLSGPKLCTYNTKLIIVEGCNYIGMFIY